MGTPVSRPVRVLVASLVIALVVGAASTAAFATGANPNCKLAIHLKAHPTSCTKGYPTFTNASTIVYNWANSGDVDAMPVFYDLTQYTVVETGLTWPAGWGTGSWTKCKGDLIIGTITNPGDGFAIAWTACQTSWAITPGYEWLTATSAGQVLPVPDPVTEDYGVVDCAPEPGPYYQYPIAIYAGGVDGGVGENPTVNPVCNVDPAALDFGTVTIGGWQQRSFTLKNTGGGEMTGRVSVAPADSATWSLISGGGLYVLKNNEFINIVVQFKPKTAGTYNTTILTGASICSGVACTGVGEAANPPACQVNPASLNFMSVVVGDSLDKSFTITNTGGGTLSGTVTASCTDFSIVSGGGAYNLTGGQRDTVVVRFKPTSAVTESCTVNTGGSCAAVKCQGSGEYLPLTISKDDGIAANACAFPSSNVTYTLTYSNPNHTQVTGVVVTDNLPTNVTFVSATNGGVYSGGNNQVTWNIGTLGAGVGASVGVTTTVKPSASPDSGLANNCQITSNETPTPVIASHSTAVCACAISGPSLACPLSTIQFCAPAGMTSYAWSVSGNGSVSGAANGQCVMVLAGAACNSSYTVKLDLVQAGGVQSHCEYVVSVNDTSTPQITSCPGAIHVQCKGNVPAADTALVTATDSCGVVHVTFVGDVSDGHTCPEVITRTYRATDLCGNHADCIQTITVLDTIPPQITQCPPADTVQCVSDVPAPDTTLVTATDNCGAVHVTHLSDVWGVPHAPLGNVSCAQVLTRTYRVTDLCGNFADCQQLITVFDTEAPHVACGAPQTIECNSTPVWGTPTVTDNCDPSPALAYTDSSYTGTCPQNELLVRIWQATDLCGNVGACRQTITVHDSHAPDVSSGPPDTTVACAKDVPAPDASRVHATDNCGTVTVQWVSDVPSGTSCNQTITRTYSVTDQCTNSVNYIQTIHVIDNVNPQIACAAEEHVACGSPINFTDPTATDNCDPAPVVSVVSTTTTNGPGPGEVTHTRTWKATDSCGNFAQCSQNIIEGACACSIAGASSVCPSSTHQYCGPVDMSSYDWSISGDGSITSAHNTRCIDVQAGSTCSGSFTLTLSLNGGASQCQKTVTVTDVTGPVITVCPPPDTVQCMSDVPAPNTGLVQATDSCSAVTVAWAGDVPSGTCPTTVTRTYRANDACGNHTDCVQLIIVRDTLPPSLVCAPDGRIACGETVVFTDPQATDNCDPSPGLHVQSTTTTPGPGPGEYTHTRCWTASDVCGNVSAPCCQNIVESACPYQPLTLSKDDGVAGSVAPGDTIHYTIACGNPNNQGVTGVVITDHLPPEVGFVSASNGGTYDSNTRTVTWTVGALGGSAGNDWMLSVEVDPMIAGPTSIVNTCAAVSDQTGTSTAAETTHVEVPVIQVYIDIKPTACPNPLYINAKGVLPVAILGTAEIDVARIETSSLRLTRDGVAGEIAPVSTSLADVATPSIGGQCSCNLDGPDGNTDLVANFALKPLIQALGLGSVKGQTVVLTLKGLINPPPQPTLTKDGVRAISGSDCVMVTSGTGHDTIWIMESRSVVSSGSQAKFSFSLTENDHVRVEVFDVHGRMVQSLMDSDLGEGTYSVDWNICDASGQRVPIGIYFVRLTTRTQNATKKIVVVE